MWYQTIGRQDFILRIKRGELIIASLKNFCHKKKIFGGLFFGLGAVDEVELAHYDVSSKKYSSKKFDQPLEMTNLIGNIAIFKKELILHAHATFSDRKMAPIAGHLVEAKISGTAEVFIKKFPKLNKIYDEESGLKIFNFKTLF